MPLLTNIFCCRPQPDASQGAQSPLAKLCLTGVSLRPTGLECVCCLLHRSCSVVPWALGWFDVVLAVLMMTLHHALPHVTANVISPLRRSVELFPQNRAIQQRGPLRKGRRRLAAVRAQVAASEATEAAAGTPIEKTGNSFNALKDIEAIKKILPHRSPPPTPLSRCPSCMINLDL